MSFPRAALTPELVALATRAAERLSEHGLLPANWRQRLGFTAFHAENLPFYQGAHLLVFPLGGAISAHDPGYAGRHAGERRVIAHHDELFVLAGGLEPIYQANHAVPLSLTRENVGDYLRFYLEHVEDKAGGLYLVEAPADIPWHQPVGNGADGGPYQAARVEPLIRPLRLLDTDDAGYVLMATALYDDALFRASFRVDFDGTLTVESEEQVAGELDVRTARRRPPPGRSASG